MKVTKLLVSKGVDAVATGHSHADFPNGDGTSFYAKYPGVDDVNGLINGKPVVMAGKFGDHLGIMDVKLTYTDGKWKVVNSKAKLEKIDTKSDIADKALIDMAAHDHDGTISTMFVRKLVRPLPQSLAILLKFRTIHLFKSKTMRNCGMPKNK